MDQGHHSVEVEARDSAGNETDFEFHFETTQRGDFVLPLVAGWNAVSVPSDPIDPATESVFTNPAIEVVISWDPDSFESPWAISLRDGDSWEPVIGSGVPEIVARRGYWVNSSELVEQTISLSQTVTGTVNWRTYRAGSIGVGILSASPIRKANKPKTTSVSRCGTTTAMSRPSVNICLASLGSIFLGIRSMVNTVVWHLRKRRQSGGGYGHITELPRLVHDPEHTADEFGSRYVTSYARNGSTTVKNGKR